VHSRSNLPSLERIRHHDHHLANRRMVRDTRHQVFLVHPVLCCTAIHIVTYNQCLKCKFRGPRNSVRSESCCSSIKRVQLSCNQWPEECWALKVADDCQLIAQPTWWYVLDDHTTPSAIGVLQWLGYALETHYLLNYDNVTVSESSNGCWRHTCLGTTTV